MPELVGALMVHGQRVDMVREAEDRLLIPVCPPGVYLAEVRAAGVCVLYGHVEVLPSPLYEQDGVVCYTIDVDAMTDVLAVSLSMVEGIPGPRGAQGIQGERGLQGASAYDLAVAAGYEGSEAEWVAELQGAQAAANAARASESAAAESARAAREDKAAAVQARDAALAAQSTAAEQAAIATKAAADAQAPESIAAQAARPATMLLVRDELMSLLGDASLFDIDTDGQIIIVHTDRLADDQLAAVTDMLGRFVPVFIEVVQYNHNMEISWRDINKYAECVTVEDMLAVNPDYKNDLTSEGEWVYPLSELQSEQNLFANSPMLKFSSNFPKVKTFYNTFQLSALPGEVVINAESATSANRLLNQTNITKATLNLPNATDINRVCNYCFQLEELRGNLNKAIGGEAAFYRCEKLRVFEIELPSLSNGNYFFTAAKLNKDSALRVLNSIPSYTSGTHTLTLGIHIDHQQDEEVLAAISDAEAKGWTLTVQWNGTPTSTASMLRFGQLIYAKVGEHELPDGTTERVLDWGHYVTNETGYETFRSLESAYEYFDLPAEEGGEE